MIQIYHNQKCSKSREGVCFMKDRNIAYQEIRYLENPPTHQMLKSLIEKLGIKPIELVRTKEAIWKENYKDKNLNDEQVIAAMVKYPQLIERPIIINGDKAVIGRPVERILEIL